METKSKPGKITAFSMGTLAGVALAAFSVLIRRWQRRPPETAGELASLPASTPQRSQHRQSRSRGGDLERGSSQRAQYALDRPH